MKYPPQYFQGILQLRECKKEIINYVYEETEKEGREDIEINKRIKVGNSKVDLYFTSNKFLRVLGKRLQNKYGGELKINERLFSKNSQTSKDVYRLNVLFRPAKVKIGEVIEVRGKKIKVMSLGNKVQGKEIETGKRCCYTFKEVQQNMD